MAKRRCIDCDQLTQESPCSSCTRERRRRRNADRRIASAVVAAWVAEHGWVCPGYLRAQHPSRDLTADHVLPYARGGTNEGERAVLCRACNSRKGSK